MSDPYPEDTRKSDVADRSESGTATQSELPDGVTQEPRGHYDHDRYGGTEHCCPECSSTFGEFYSANYCPVCKEKVDGRTTDGGSNLSQFTTESDGER